MWLMVTMMEVAGLTSLRRDRHYLNDKGRCIACSELKGLGPDDNPEVNSTNKLAEEYVVIDDSTSPAKCSH